MGEGDHRDPADSGDESFTLETGTTSNDAPASLRKLWRGGEIGGAGLTRAQRLRRATLSTGSVALVLAVVLVGFYGMRPALHLFESTPPMPHIILTARAGMNGITDAVWSGDGARIAALGLVSGSGYTGFERQPPQIAVIFDGHTGAVIARLYLNALVLRQIADTLGQDLVYNASPAGISDNNLLGFTAIQWSPDNYTLAMPFFFVARPLTRDVVLNGILLTDASGQNPRVYLTQTNQSGNIVTAWDIRTGTPTTAPLGRTSVIPPALVYRWTSDDHLQAVVPLSTSSVPVTDQSSLIGTPDGGREFSIWQPGRLLPVNMSGDLGNASGYAWGPAITAWSPDGHVLSFLMSSSATATVLPRNATSAVPAAGPPTYLVRSHDTALDELLAMPTYRAQNGWQLAWRPDGAQLAIYGPIAHGPVHLSIYSTRTGKSLATLGIPLIASRDQTQSGTTALLRWTSDGTHLLFFSSLFGAIYTWGPGTLPHGE